MALPYYVKKRIQNIIISIFMLAFLALTLLPIGWMVYSSLKDSTDIAIGKVGMRRAGRDVLVIKPVKEDLLALSADGGINLYRAADLKNLKHVSYKTAASSYLVDDKYIWIASANKGLIRVLRDDLKKSQSFTLPVWGFDMNKVTTTYIKNDERNIFVSFDYKDFDGVFRFDTQNMKFMKLLKGAKKQYFPNAGQLKVKEMAGIDGEIFSEAKVKDTMYYGTANGILYKYEPATKKVIAQARLPRGHLLVRWHNYVDMWKSVNFGLYLRNSLIICGFTMFFAMIFSTLAAYALSRFRFPGSDLFSNSILATQMIPAIMYLIPLYIMFVRFTILTGIPVKGTFPGIIMIYSAFFLPFSIWILRGFFAAIPKELEEAALIDGCSRFKVFWHVALPLAVPGIIATGIYIFLTAWDELMFAWVLTNADTMTIPVGIRLFVGNYQNRFDLMMAAAVVATLPVVVLFLILQRHIVKGLTAGAVKG
ncbi:MAG: carbohydrate ABC transporter permease [Candidatus Margulisiibacteriota bacterium]